MCCLLPVTIIYILKFVAIRLGPSEPLGCLTAKQRPCNDEPTTKNILTLLRSSKSDASPSLRFFASRAPETLTTGTSICTTCILSFDSRCVFWTTATPGADTEVSCRHLPFLAPAAHTLLLAPPSALAPPQPPPWLRR